MTQIADPACESEVNYFDTDFVPKKNKNESFIILGVETSFIAYICVQSNFRNTHISMVASSSKSVVLVTAVCHFR